jgi:hypothetical protein
VEEETFLGLGHDFNAPRKLEADVVHQPVEPPEGAHHRLEGSADRRAIARIRGDRERALRIQGRDGRFQGRAVARDERYAGAALEQAHRRGETDAFGSAGHDDHLILEVGTAHSR